MKGSVGVSTSYQDLFYGISLYNPRLIKKTINVYLNLVIKHLTSDSRDSLHLATCIENNIKTIITHDHGFKKFKELKTLTPEESIAKMP